MGRCVGIQRDGRDPGYLSTMAGIGSVIDGDDVMSGIDGHSGRDHAVRAQSDHRHQCALGQLSLVDGTKRRGQRVREQHRGRVGELRADADQGMVGHRDADMVGMSTSRREVPVGTSRPLAAVRLALSAVPAATARVRRAQHHPVAGHVQMDVRADLGDRPHRFPTQPGT